MSDIPGPPVACVPMDSTPSLLALRKEQNDIPTSEGGPVSQQKFLSIVFFVFSLHFVPYCIIP
jgi:hypothetical protein